MADALSCILNRAASAGHISPVISNLIPSGISHLQYADDMIILVQNNDNCIANLKFLLLCFDSLSGLKINLAKSKAMVLGSDLDEANQVANLLNYKLGSFPMTYLGIPISTLKLCLSAFAPSVLKVGNRAMP